MADYVFDCDGWLDAFSKSIHGRVLSFGAGSDELEPRHCLATTISNRGHRVIDGGACYLGDAIPVPHSAGTRPLGDAMVGRIHARGTCGFRHWTFAAICLFSILNFEF